MEDVDEPVHLREWSPDWSEVAGRLKAECAVVLADEAMVAVEHVGSTAVPGLVAKPVIDLLVGVQPGRRGAVAARLAAAGWTHLGEAGIPGREYLRRRHGQHANVHVVDLGSTLWTDDVLLRDHLREDAQARHRYAAAKRQAARGAPMLLAYSARKAGVVAELLADAKRARR